MSKKQPLKVFEAFAGIGAQVKALDICKINYESVGISEWFVDAIIAYDKLHNHGELIEIPGRDQIIKELSSFSFSIDSQRKKENLNSLNENKLRQLYVAHKRSKNYGSIVEIDPEKLPEIDLLTYSFPCQDLSTGGKTKGMKKGSGTRSGLLWEIERILKGLNKKNKLPKYLLLENVPTIIAQSNKADLDEWLSFLSSLGYKNSEPSILDASKFGVPQDRKRCIIFSILTKRGKAPDISPESLKMSTDYSARSFIFDDYTNPVYRAEADAASLNCTPSREEMWRINKRDPLTEQTIFHTITCNMDRSNNAGMLKYKTPNFPHRKYRLLTMRESFLLMGFDIEDYNKANELGYSYRRMNKLIGNSIVVNILVAVFKKVFEGYVK